MNETQWDNYRYNRFHVYCGIASVLTILCVIRIVTMKIICWNSARILHNR